MGLILAAVGAVAAALLNLSIAPLIQIDGAQPDLLLTAAVIWTVVAGLDGGLVWAFIGGLMIDLLAPRPLGSTAFTLLICVGGAALLARLLVQFRYVAPIVGVLLFSIVNAVLFVLVNRVLTGPFTPPDLMAAVVPPAVYDAVIAAIVGPLVVAVVARRQDRERPTW